MPDPTITSVNAKPPRSTSMAKSGSKPVRVERARVINVNISDYTVDTRSESPPYKPKFDIPWMVPYTHFSQGEGINFMPEVGSTCWICEPSEDGREAFVLGWTMPDEHGAYRAGRELLNPGDIHLSTRDGNFVTVRRGGVVQLGATPVCQRVFIPIRNIIQDFAENYELHTPAGDLTWSVLRQDTDGDGHQRCLLTLAAHEFSDDPVNTDPIAILKIGSHGANDNTILTLSTRDKGGGSVQTALLLDKSGNLDWQVQGTFHVKSTGDMTLESSGKATMTSQGDMALSSTTGAFSAKGATSASLSSDGTVSIKGTAGSSMDGAFVKLGDAQFPVLINSPDLVLWISMVTAALSGVAGVPALRLGPALKPPVLYTSTKVIA